MLFIKSHRMHVQPDDYDAYAPGADRKLSMSSACGFQNDEAYPDPTTAPFAPFDYFFPEAPVSPHEPTTTQELDTLADSMMDVAQAHEDNTDVPAIITYLGQFIDHDITAGTDRQSDFSNVDLDDVPPQPRDAVRHTIANLRTGALDLDSLYGGATVQGNFAAEMTKRLRHPVEKAKLRIGADIFVARSGPRPARPRSPQEDPAHDLLRAERLIRDADPLMAQDMIDNLPQDLQDFLLDNEQGTPNPARAVIGDGRNDENLAVATVHLAFARLHNRIVDHAPSGSADKKYAWAQKQVRWIYQWLLINVYLPSICDAATLADVIASDAKFYKAFMDRVPHKDGHLPMPLEFSVSAFRFGHSTARPDYDWNANFGRAEPGQTAILSRAGFDLMFAFTGNGRMAGGAPKLPSGWMVDGPRFLNTGPVSHADRCTRLIDTKLAPALHKMQNEPEGMKKVLRVLPRRNLRRGQLLAIPSAQACIAGFDAAGISLPSLTEDQLRHGTGDKISDTLVKNTPLWFYVLKEAELLNGGMRLGPLGTRIIAETLVGLTWHGKGTYRHETGSDSGVWHPRDGVQIDGAPVDSLEALMRAALIM